MAKNYALEILETEEAVLKERIAEIRFAIASINHEYEEKPIIKIDNIKTLPEPVKNPAAFHVTKAVKEWLDEQPTLSLEALKKQFPHYKEATAATQLYNYKRTTGRS